MTYSINEEAARRAKSANSFYDYTPDSATAEYRRMVDQATELAEHQKSRVDPMYHDKIDNLLDTYARKLAANMNDSNAIDARVPSVMIAGPANFPVRAKEKQNAARDRNMEEYNHIQGLLDKIGSTGTGGISSDDPVAIEKLKAKLADHEEEQETMKRINAYYRTHKTLEGCPYSSEDILRKIAASMARDWRADPKPFESWALSNNSANIRRIKDRIADLEKKAEKPAEGWEFDGGTVEINTELNRIQIRFDEKPGEELRAQLKSAAFKWAPSQDAWQRQLTANAIYAAKRINAIRPA